MSDHWNLLADQLGTPNLAPRSKKTPKNEPTSEPSAAMAPAKSKTSVPPADPAGASLSSSSLLPRTSDDAPSDPISADKPRVSRSRSAAGSQKKPKPPTEAIQDDFGGGLCDSPEPPETTRSQTEPVQETPPPGPKSQPSASRTSEPGTQSQRSKEPQVREEPQIKEPREKSMLQSSWDALANLFGVSSDSRRESTPNPVPTKAPAPKVQETKDSLDRNAQSNRPNSKRSAQGSMWDSEEKSAVSQSSQESIKSHEALMPTGTSPRNQRHDPKDQDPVETDRRGPRRSPRRGQRDDANPPSDRPSIEPAQEARAEEGFDLAPARDTRRAPRSSQDQDRRGSQPSRTSETRSGNRTEDRPTRDRRDDDRSRVERNEKDRPVSERRDNDRRDNDRPANERSSTERRGSDRRDNDRPTNDRRDHERTSGDRRDSDRQDNDRPASDRRESDRRESDRRNNDRRGSDRPVSDRRDGDRRDRNLRPESDRRKEHSGFAQGIASDPDPIDMDREDEVFFDQRTEESNEPPRSDRNRDTQESSSLKERRPRRRGRRNPDSNESIDSPTKQRSEDSFDEFDDVNDSDRSEDASENRPKHGKVPSWTETIGAVIESNVANHQRHSSGGRARHRRPNN